MMYGVINDDIIPCVLYVQLLRAQTLDLGYTLLPRTRSGTHTRLPKRSASCPELLLLHTI